MKNDELSTIRKNWGGELAESIEMLFEDAEQRIKTLESKLATNTPNVEVIDDDYDRIEKEIINHFFIDGGKSHGVDFGFFGQSESERGAAICASLASQYLRILNARYPEFFQHQDKEESDLKLTIEFIKNHAAISGTQETE